MKRMEFHDIYYMMFLAALATRLVQFEHFKEHFGNLLVCGLRVCLNRVEASTFEGIIKLIV